VSIFEVDPTNVTRSRVTRTLLGGDEPRDVVFAGTGRNRAFITCAHRGQNRPGDPQLTTPGIGRADVWAFDANNLGAALGGTALSLIAVRNAGRWPVPFVGCWVGLHLGGVATIIALT